MPVMAQRCQEVLKYVPFTLMFSVIAIIYSCPLCWRLLYQYLLCHSFCLEQIEQLKECRPDV
jgi:hypothetical protein